MMKKMDIQDNPFVRGMFSILSPPLARRGTVGADILPFLKRPASDFQALHGDWEAVGCDIFRAVRRHEQESDHN